MIRARLGLACAAATGVWLVLGGSAFAADQAARSDDDRQPAGGHQ